RIRTWGGAHLGPVTRVSRVTAPPGAAGTVVTLTANTAALPHGIFGTVPVRTGAYRVLPDSLRRAVSTTFGPPAAWRTVNRASTVIGPVPSVRTRTAARPPRHESIDRLSTRAGGHGGPVTLIDALRSPPGAAGAVATVTRRRTVVPHSGVPRPALVVTV